jgi:glycine dehydrogenase subunit 1
MDFGMLAVIIPGAGAWLHERGRGDTILTALNLWRDPMPPRKPLVYPYIPNSAPEVKAEMLRAVSAQSAEDFYADIPERLRFKGRLNLPAPYLDEHSLRRHVNGLLEKNTTAREVISFLGAGCYDHIVPAVCDEINSRGEFLTAYAGEPYEDHGRFQALFEYESMMGELLNMDVVNVPNYDGYQAAATALRMAGRITGRDRVLVAGSIAADRLSKICDYLTPDMQVDIFPFHSSSGLADLQALRGTIIAQYATVYFENPSYLGTIEVNAAQISRFAHESGALCVVCVDPISLGVLNPPAEYGADIACGDIQPLGIHMNYGGGHGGFIATRDEPRFVMEFPSRLFGITPTRVEGEYGFGDVAYERTSFAVREEGKEWVGTAAALWGITAGVYLALMGPEGMREIGESILRRTRYAIRKIGAISGVRVPFAGTPHFQEFVVNFDKRNRKVVEVNQELLSKGIFGGKDLSNEFPELGQSALYCITESHRQQDIDRLVEGLQEVLS